MADCMMFPKDWHEFLKDCSFKDTKEIYTNGSELIPVFRVEQLIEHLLKEQESTINELQNAYGYLQKEFFEAQDKLLKEQEAVVRCKDCKLQDCEERSGMIVCITGESHSPDWYCADGERRTD